MTSFKYLFYSVFFFLMHLAASFLLIFKFGILFLLCVVTDVHII